jgi:hypothetical protein
MDARIFIKKTVDLEWFDYPRADPLTNRNMHHGYVVKVQANLVEDFLQKYNDKNSENIHYGSKVTVRNLLGVQQDGYVFSIEGHSYVVHFPGKSYRCDVEFSKNDILASRNDDQFIPTPKHMFYGLPPINNNIFSRQLYIVPVLECLLSTPYFKWYLERKKYNDALAS